MSCLVLLLATALGCTGNRATDSGPPEDPGPPSPECPVFEPASDGLPVAGEWRTRPGIGDIDGDGLDDIVGLARKGHGPQVYLSNGLGGWTEASEGLTYPGKSISCGYGTRLADLDGDDDLDIALGDHCKGIWAFENLGDGTWRAASKGIPRNMEGFNDVAVGDLDGDGHLDLVGISAFTRGFLVVRGRGDGTWEWVRDTGLPEVGLGWEVHLADVNGDGRLDVLSSFNNSSSNRRHETPPPAKIWLQQEDGSFAPTEGFPDEGRWFGVAALGHEGDPGLDVYFTLFGFKAGIRRFTTNDGFTWTDRGRLDGPWVPGVDRKSERGYTGIAILPINGDVCPDMIFAEMRSRSIRVALGDCGSRWYLCPAAIVPEAEIGGQPWGIGAGDFNGDGRADLTVAYGTSSLGGIAAWLQTDRLYPLDEDDPQGQGLIPSMEERGSGEPAPNDEP